VHETIAERQDAGTDWLFARTPRRRTDVLLDVGSGEPGPALAGDVRQVVAVADDLSELEARRRATARGGIDNVLYVRAEVASLPFLDASFRVALCGLALHRFCDPRVELTEIGRVLEPGGWLALADLVVSEDPEIAAVQNDIERLADPRHARALSASDLQDTLVRSGYEVTRAETHQVRRPLALWLEQSRTGETSAQQIAAALAVDAAGGAPTGLAPRIEDDGRLSVAHTLTSLLVLNRDG
jgi:ubiquinone/menaquinone biosynthesis C-methylase UbiE